MKIDTVRRRRRVGMNREEEEDAVEARISSGNFGARVFDQDTDRAVVCSRELDWFNFIFFAFFGGTRDLAFGWSTVYCYY